TARFLPCPRRPANRALPCPAACAPPRPAARRCSACAALQPARCPALQPASPCCSRHLAACTPCSTRRPAARDALQLTRPAARVTLPLASPCSLRALQPASPCCQQRSAARTPCTLRRPAARVALQPTRPAACVALLPASPCSPRALLPTRALPCSPRATQPCSLRVALPYSLHAALPRSPRAALPCCPHALQPARRPAHTTLQPACRSAACAPCTPHPATLQPARCPTLPSARRLALQPALTYCPRACAARALLLARALLTTHPTGLHSHSNSCYCSCSHSDHCYCYSCSSSSSVSRRLYRRSSFDSGSFGEAALVLELWISLVLEVLDSSGSSVAKRLSRHSSFVSGLFSKAVLVVEVMVLESGQQRQQRQQEILSPQQLREWVSQRCIHGSAEATSLARASTVLPCPAAPSSSLTGFHLPSFSKNLVSNALLQDQFVSVSTPGGELVAFCTDSHTSENLTTFTRSPGSGLYTVTTESAQVAVSGQVAASCLCRLLSHQTLLWHHHLGHPSLPRLRGMHSRLLVSGLPRSLPPLPRLPAPPCLPCVEGRHRAAPHISLFPPTTTPLQTLHMDEWGPACVRGHDHECYFLLVIGDYMRYTLVFPLRSKTGVRVVLIVSIITVRRHLSTRFQHDHPDLRLHSDRGGEFSSGLFEAFYRAEGIAQSFTLPASPQHNGIGEGRISLIMEVARTSMIHVAAPHFLWPFAVRYAAHQLNLWPRVSVPETSPTLHWTGEVGDASMFQVWGALSLVRDTTVTKLSPRTLCYVFLGFPTDAPPWSFYHPASCRVLSSQDATFDESVCFYRLHPYASSPLSPSPLFLVPGPPPVDPLPPQGPATLGVS
ncbi:unnamed protein product, partial [Closterium sp. NIES-54]